MPPLLMDGSGAAVEVGVRVPRALFAGGVEPVAAFAAAAEAAGLDRLWVGDHVSFKGGQGYDGLLQATALTTLSRRIAVQTAVYLLPLRHPLPVARQVASVAELAPGRLVFGVGVGGDDPAEVANSGVDPATRGRRMDESLALVRRLLAGEVVDHRGEHFILEGAAIRPTPEPAVPIVIGGRAPAALRRAGRLGDGWLGVWVSPERFAESTAAVAHAASEAGRRDVAWQHGLLAWCGFGPSAELARAPLAAAMEDLYQMPFGRFARHSPHGTPEDVASALAPYVDGGASTLLLAAVADDPEEVVAGAARVRDLLRRA
jgi:alkanesulfonate monooxygenase SsuD/methylene tetrahydromethanopterin reductase-like flavin-dependent oxidoreductase (luciferase family)